MGKRGPKPEGLDEAAERRIAELAAQNWGPGQIAKELGVNAKTVSRRVAALRGPAKVRAVARPAPAAPPPASDSGADVDGLDDEDDEELPAADAVPAGASLEQLDRWLAKAEKAVSAAEAVKNFPLMSNLLRTAAQLADMRRKQTPPPVEDPNERPDMVALGKQVRERLHKMVDLVCEESRQG